MKVLKKLLQKLKNLLRRKKKQSNIEIVQEGTKYVFKNINDEYYLQDSDGVHAVTIFSISFDVVEDIIEVEYTSSSDLEKRGLMPHLKEMVRKIYIDGELLK